MLHKLTPAWMVVPLTAVLFALGGLTAGGVGPMVFSGVAGVVWGFILVLIAKRINRTVKAKYGIANALLIAAGALLFMTLGAGILTYMLIGEAIKSAPEWLTTITKGPLAEQEIMFYILFNSLLEAIVIPLLILLNWGNAKRRKLILVGAGLFYAIRIWTYAYFAPEYMNYDKVASLGQLTEMLKTRMQWDYARCALNALQAVLFLCAALIPASLKKKQEK